VKLILVRHGETDLNRDGRILGLTDAPLNATGRSQASAVAAPLAAELPFKMYVSPLARAMETAHIVGDALGITPTPLIGLQEADAGELDGLKASDVQRLYPEFASRWEHNAATAQMPGGESLMEVQTRAWKAVTQLAREHGEVTIVAVTHNFVIGAILCKTLETPLRNFRRLRLDVGSLTRLDLSSSHPRLLSMNDTSHLEAVK